MYRRQTLWLASVAVAFCGALAWWSFGGSKATQRSELASQGPTAVTLVSTTAQDSEKAEKAPAPTKRKKKVTGKNEEGDVQYNKLTPAEAYIILHKGTERPWTGEYTELKDPGTYVCRRCNAALYHSDTKFESHCGWPSFDDEIKGAVIKRVESDGTGRMEIVCANCGGHLGHVFYGEGFTAKNTRHCVNSKSMTFVAQGKPLPKVIKPAAKDSKEGKEPEAEKTGDQVESAPAENKAGDTKANSSSANTSTKPGSANSGT